MSKCGAGLDRCAPLMLSDGMTEHHQQGRLCEDVSAVSIVSAVSAICAFLRLPISMPRTVASAGAGPCRLPVRPAGCR